MKYTSKLIGLLFLITIPLCHSQTNIPETINTIIKGSQTKFQSFKGNFISTQDDADKFESKLKIKNAETYIYKDHGDDYFKIEIVYDNTVNIAQNQIDGTNWEKEFQRLIKEKNFEKLQSYVDNKYSLMAGFEAYLFKPAITMLWNENEILITIRPNIKDAEEKKSTLDQELDKKESAIYQPKVVVKKDNGFKKNGLYNPIYAVAQISTYGATSFKIDKYAREQIVKNKKITIEQFEMICDLATDENLPKGIISSEYENQRTANLMKYNGFLVDKVRLFTDYCIVWFPYEDNLHMPVECQPLTKDGFYMFIDSKSLSSEKNLKPETTAIIEQIKYKLTYLIKDANHAFDGAQGSFRDRDRNEDKIFYGSRFFIESQDNSFLYSTTKDFVFVENIKNESTSTKLLIENLKNVLDDYAANNNLQTAVVSNDDTATNSVVKSKIVYSDKTNFPLLELIQYPDNSQLQIKIYSNKKDRLRDPEHVKKLALEQKNYAATLPTQTNSPQTYSSGNLSTSSYALDIFKEQGSIVIYRGSKMYVVKVKGKKKQDVNITAAQANQLLGFTGAFKFEWFPGNNCTTLKSKYGASFTVICQGEINLDN